MPTRSLDRKRQDPRRETLRRLGAAVKARRRERGITQEVLADVLGLSVSYVSLIERGGRNPPFTTVVDIARALGVTLRELLDD